MTQVEFISMLTLIFLVAAGLLVVAARYSWPVIPFYLLAGMLVSPFIEENVLLTLAQWGVAFLVFAFAVEIDPLESGDLRGDSIGVSIVQFVVTGALMVLIGFSIGLTALNAVIFALAAALGSSLVTLSLLERRIRLRSLHQRLAESFHFVEDVLAVLAVMMLSAFVYTDSGMALVAFGGGLIILGIAIRRFVFDRIVTFAGGDVEILMLTGISVIIGFIALAEFAGISIVVGAFAAGLAVSTDYPYDVEMLDSISYLEDFFAPIFFVTVGALVTVPTGRTLLIGGLLVLAVVVVNPMVIYGLLRERGYDSRTSVLTGTSVDQVSEFALIIAIEAFIIGAIAREVFDAIVLAALITMFTSIITDRYAEPGYQYLVSRGILDPDESSIRERSNVPDDLADHVVVSGYNREGQQVVEALKSIDQPFVVIESDPARETIVKTQCEYYVFGDAKTESAWVVANAKDAVLLVATDPRRKWTEHLLSYDLGVDTIVHATDVEIGAEFLDRGVLFVAIPDILVAERIEDCVRQIVEGDITPAALHESAVDRLEQARDYGPSDVRRIR